MKAYSSIRDYCVGEPDLSKIRLQWAAAQQPFYSVSRLKENENTLQNRILRLLLDGLETVPVHLAALTQWQSTLLLLLTMSCLWDSYGTETGSRCALLEEGSSLVPLTTMVLQCLSPWNCTQWAAHTLLFCWSMKSTVVSSEPFPPTFSNSYWKSLFLVYVVPIIYNSRKFCLQISFFLTIYVCLVGKEYILHEVCLAEVQTCGYKCVYWGVTTGELYSNRYRSLLGTLEPAWSIWYLLLGGTDLEKRTGLATAVKKTVKSHISYLVCVVKNAAFNSSEKAESQLLVLVFFLLNVINYINMWQLISPWA